VTVWRLTYFLVIALLSPATLCASENPSIVTLDCAARGARQVDLPADEGLLVFVNSAPVPAWLEFKEAGQSVEVGGQRNADRLQVRVPPRYSWSFVSLAAGERIEIHRFDPSRALGRVEADLHCALDVQLQRRVDWFRAASAVSSAVRGPAEEGGYGAIAESVRALNDTAPDAVARALALHLRAQALLMNGHNADASDAFARAETAWSAIGETERALAARVGRVEDANRAARYRDVLDLTMPARGADTLSREYFGVRLETSRCLALWYLDRLAEARTCYQAALAGFERLGESTEYAVTLQAYADLQAILGDSEDAERLANRALGMLHGANAAMAGGRLQELLGNLALLRGAVIESLGRFDLALSDFDNARAPHRLLANVEMRVSQIYEELGAYDEALGHLGNAVKHYTMRDAPARMAAAMLRFSYLESDLGHVDSARLWAFAAEAAYASLQMPAEREAARISSLTLQLRGDGVANLAWDAGTFRSLQPADRTSLGIIAAATAVRTGDVAAARLKLDALRRNSLSLRQRVDLALVEARYWNALGDTQRALAELSATAGHIDMLARTTRNPVLASVLSRRLLPLRRAAMQTILNAAGVTSPGTSSASLNTIESVWIWLAADAAHPAAGGSGATAVDARFDRAVADELLSPQTARTAAGGSSAQRNLLSLLSQSPASGVGVAPTLVTMSLAQFQQQLDPGTAFMAYVDAGTTGALLWVTRTEATIRAAGTPDDVRAAARALRDLLRSPEVPVEQINAAATRVSFELLQAAPGSAPPERLIVLVEEPLNGVAWSVLPWRDGTEPLLEQTTVRLASLSTDTTPDVQNHVLHVVVAAQKRGVDSALPELAGAAVEPRLIANALTGRSIDGGDGSKATRESTLAALADPGAWVHIASHGIAQPQRIGYAGIWLDAPTAGAPSAFLSWLEVLDAGVSADMVVLNACDLDDHGEAIDGNLSFASAVSRAGAHWVVAAMWPVSDSASMLWVPEFYAALGAGGDVATGLRTAQQRLRSTRAFRHPFFWAGMQATERWSIGNVAPLRPEKAPTGSPMRQNGRR